MGDSRPEARASSIVWKSLVTVRRSRSIPLTIAFATSSADRTFTLAESVRVASGFVAASAARPGVSTSDGYAQPTTMPCGLSSARSVSARPRTANFAGEYPAYPYDADDARR